MACCNGHGCHGSSDLSGPAKISQSSSGPPSLKVNLHPPVQRDQEIQSPDAPHLPHPSTADLPQLSNQESTTITSRRLETDFSTASKLSPPAHLYHDSQDSAGRIPVDVSSSLPPSQVPRTWNREASSDDSEFDAERSNGSVTAADAAESRGPHRSSNHLSEFPHQLEPRTNGDDCSINATSRSHKQANDDPISRPHREANSDPGCPSTKNIQSRHLDWLSGTILFLSIFSTTFSGIYLVIAIRAPEYGSRIRPDGGILAPSTASTLSALFAKLIELSFVTVFITFLGQMLSRKAFKNSHGLTLSELSFRSWIMQPGTLITHFESIRYGARTYLGIVSLIVCITAMLYTTASDALVAPILKLGKPQPRMLYGQVVSSYANIDYLITKCQTPISRGTDIDPNDPTADTPGRNCVAISMAQKASYNANQFYANWSQIKAAGLGISDQKFRPVVQALLYDNATITGSWVENRNKTEDSLKWGRRVFNVTLAMPHAGIFQAVKEPRNGILQPDSLDNLESISGFGRFRIVAALPAPSVNVVCVGLTLNETKPFARYNSYWDSGILRNFTGPLANDDNATTAVDEIFGFKPGSKAYVRPMFPNIPGDWNTVQYTSYVDQTSFLIGKLHSVNPLTHPYDFCAVKSILYTSCSTHYQYSFGRGILHTLCQDDSDSDRYDFIHSNRSTENLPPLDPNYPLTQHPIQTSFASVSDTILIGLSLSTGDVNANASASRILTNLIPQSNESDPNAPSAAEAIAIMLSSGLLESSLDSPFVHYWNRSYPSLTFPNSILDNFRATVQSQQYASGGNQPWQRIFHVVLVLTFLINCLCLIYLGLCIYLKRGVVTDFTEPQNMFTLAINSPRSDCLVGTCGGGPEKSHYALPWFFRVDKHDHVYISEQKLSPSQAATMRKDVVGKTTIEVSPLMNSYMELNQRQHRIL